MVGGERVTASFGDPTNHIILPTLIIYTNPNISTEIYVNLKHKNGTHHALLDIETETPFLPAQNCFGLLSANQQNP